MGPRPERRGVSAPPPFCSSSALTSLLSQVSPVLCEDSASFSKVHPNKLVLRFSFVTGQRAHSLRVPGASPKSETESCFLAFKALDQLLVAWGSRSVASSGACWEQCLGEQDPGTFGFLVIMHLNCLIFILTSGNIVKVCNIILDSSGLTKYSFSLNMLISHVGVT